MAQAGIHGLVGLSLVRRMPNARHFRLGFILGNILPDADILVAGFAALARLSPDDFHRTFSHSVLTAATIAVAFCLIGRRLDSRVWTRMGLGLSLGMTFHAIVDLFLWFRGVSIFWPIPWRPCLWRGVNGVARWWIPFDLTAEFACFAIFFAALILLARRKQANDDYLIPLWCWTGIEISLFAAFTIFALVRGPTLMDFRVCWWLAYIPSLGVMLYAIIRMRNTITSPMSHDAERVGNRSTG